MGIGYWRRLLEPILDDRSESMAKINVYKVQALSVLLYSLDTHHVLINIVAGSWKILDIVHQVITRVA